MFSESDSDDRPLPYPYNRLPIEKSKELQNGLKKLDSLIITASKDKSVRHSLTIQEKISIVRKMSFNPTIDALLKRENSQIALKLNFDTDK